MSEETQQSQNSNKGPNEEQRDAVNAEMPPLSYEVPAVQPAWLSAPGVQQQCHSPGTPAPETAVWGFLALLFTA